MSEQQVELGKPDGAPEVTDGAKRREFAEREMFHFENKRAAQNISSPETPRLTDSSQKPPGMEKINSSSLYTHDPDSVNPVGIHPIWKILIIPGTVFFLKMFLFGN